MSELPECLLSHRPRIIDMPATMTRLEDPVRWAIDLMCANAKRSVLEIMKWEIPTPLIGDDVVFHLDPTNPRILNKFISGVRTGRAVHGLLELLNYGSKEGRLLENAGWAWEISKCHFIETLLAKHRLGFYIKSTLWLSSGEHIYQAHCDVADGFLIHMSGRKHVRVWPTPQHYLDEVIFNFSDFEGRMNSQPMDFVLQPGQILFIPGGAMHEVIAKEKQTAVSVSFHMGSPYPMLTLCKELNKLLGREDVFLPEEMNSRKKFEIQYFQPSDHFGIGDQVGDRIPDALAQGLLGSLQSRTTTSNELREVLNLWWKISIESPHYEQPYP